MTVSREPLDRFRRVSAHRTQGDPLSTMSAYTAKSVEWFSQDHKLV